MMKLAKKLLVIFGSVSLMSCASSNNSNEVRKYLTQKSSFSNI